MLSLINQKNMKKYCQHVILFCLLLSLSSCGFRLRGSADLAFQTIFVQGSTLTISNNLSKSLATNGVQVVKSAENADLLLEMIGEESEKRILSLAGSGTVNEFELYYRVHYRTKRAGDALWGPTQTVEARRDFTYSDANLLAKQGEEKRLNENMQADVLSGIMRRLSSFKK